MAMFNENLVNILNLVASNDVTNMSNFSRKFKITNTKWLLLCLATMLMSICYSVNA